MLLAYLTSIYPAVSHTFIRREILELERRGHRVLRISVRPPGQLVDPRDREEAAQTHALLGRGVLALAAQSMLTALSRPLRTLRALRVAARLARRSDRGWLRHLAYFMEACSVLHLVRRHDVEHLHVHFGTNAAAVAMLVYRLGGPRYSFTIHGPDEWDAPIALSLADKVEACNAVVVISGFAGAQLRRWVGPQHWHKIRVVRCALEDVDFSQPSPLAAGTDSLLCVGRLSAQKGHALLLEALLLLREEGISARVVLAGDGELRPWLELRLRESGLVDQVTITGWVTGDEVRALLRTSRALVLPSSAEGLPVVIMEAFAAARPVVTTHVGGIPELVESGVNGWLVPAGDAPALALAIKQVLQTPDEVLDEMGERGLRKARLQHHLPTEVDRLEAVFQARTFG